MRIYRLAVLAGAALVPPLAGLLVPAGGSAGSVAIAQRAPVTVPRPSPVDPTAPVPRAVAGPTEPRRPGSTTTTGPRPATPATTTPAPAAPSRAVTASPRPAPPAPATTAPAGYQGKWGVFVPDFPGTLATVDALQADVGRKANYIMWYVHWAGPYSQLSQGDLAAVTANGSTPVITWMSDDPTGATTISDAAIAAGTYDTYIRSWAGGLKSYGRPVLLRFDHEMNGNWYGWSPGANGNTAAGYIAAWRHVYGLFAQAGAANVTFVWSPNVGYTGATPLASVYPGDGYVGMVAVDGYNWGTVGGHTWQTPQQVFGPTLAEMARITSKPLIIGEVGSTSQGGDKAAWITSFFSMLSADRSIHGFIWFDMDKETDWAISSPMSALSAFEVGVSGR